MSVGECRPPFLVTLKLPLCRSQAPGSLGPVIDAVPVRSAAMETRLARGVALVDTLVSFVLRGKPAKEYAIVEKHIRHLRSSPYLPHVRQFHPDPLPKFCMIPYSSNDRWNYELVLGSPMWTQALFNSMVSESRCGLRYGPSH